MSITPLTKDDVKKVAALARLAETETETYAHQLTKILAHVENLSRVDTTGVEPTAGGSEGDGAREDAVKESLHQATALSNAPQAEKGCFKVPQVV
ncbi:MAG: Asp-tRNA(Asn)/Glu-tRNA(Gln) amidotransferase subunit GatC [Deltaproteobacteria bacterium]|nr:Asp-tRNA(Asn)/Glu-tRNA(Gln) amidotransferase subunit GatC [Deltaproteobacteria bacterium]